MCTICRKFKKGSLSVQEAREELEEQIEYLSEEHIEEVEEMILQEEDMLDYMKNRHVEDAEYDENSYEYDEDEAPEYGEEYDLDEDE
jgi:CTP:phosphocholine cytidylyltransferase-like protein